MATRLHFLTSYDVFASKGRFRWQSKIISRNDIQLVRYLLTLAKTERELIELCVSNFLYGNDAFLYNEEFTEINYKRWVKNKESQTYVLERDIWTIENVMETKNITYNQLLNTSGIDLLMSKKIEFESIIIINRRIESINLLDGYGKDKIINRLQKANKFVTNGILALTHQSIIDNSSIK